jgi:WD40 repeat protein
VDRSDLPRSHPNEIDFYVLSFSPDAQWAAGVAQDKAIYVWSLANPNPTLLIPYRKGPSVDPLVKFSPMRDYLIVRGTDGGVHAWKVGSQPDLSKPITHSAAGKTTVIFSKDGASVFLFEPCSLNWGDLGERLREVFRADSAIQDIAITPQRDKLIVLASWHLTFVRRRFYCWGLPLWDRPWPTIQEKSSR